MWVWYKRFSLLLYWLIREAPSAPRGLSAEFCC